VIPLLTGADDRRPPLFCIHPAGGISWCYGRLARALEPARDVFGLQARGLDPEAALPASLDGMAQDYVERIRAIRPDGPYHLLGWSVGGIVAHAMAVQLQAQGAEVGVLAMLDSYPSDRWRAEPEPGRNAALKALLYIAGHDPDRLPDLPLTRAAVVAFLREIGHPLGELDDRALEGVVRVVAANDRLVREHRHGRFRGALLHFRATLGNETKGLSPEGWQPYVDRLEVREVESVHGHMLAPDGLRGIVPVLNARLASRCGPVA
jgi:enterobactin synthetase component F